MNTPTTTADTGALCERVKALRFYDIAALARTIKGGPLGMDINRAFTAPDIKGQLAAWLLAQDWCSDADVLAHIDQYEQASRDYYAKKGKGKAAPKVENVPMPTPTKPAAQELSRDKIEAMTVKPEVPPQAHEAVATEHFIRTLARSEAGKLDEYLTAQFQNEHSALAQDVNDLRGQIDRLNKARPIIVTVKNGDNEHTSNLPRQHMTFNTLLKLAATRDTRGNGFNIWMTGPAGSGKTTAAENVAHALNLPFHFTGAVADEFKLLGFTDANGRVVRTPFREAFEHGGVFLFDEIDGSGAGALLAMNAALANGACDFPDQIVKRHKDCVVMAAANTWGSGATHEYIGRSKLDAASLDRFVMLPWEYDEELELTTCGNEAWAKKIQGIRRAVASCNIKHVVTPRATYAGAAMLAAGFTEAQCLDMLVYKGLSKEQRQQIQQASTRRY